MTMGSRGKGVPGSGYRYMGHGSGVKDPMDVRFHPCGYLSGPDDSPHCQTRNDGRPRIKDQIDEVDHTARETRKTEETGLKPAVRRV